MKRKVMDSESVRHSQYQSRLQYSWGEIIHQMESGQPAGILSAHRDDYDRQENERRRALLREDIHSMGYGCIEMDSGYASGGEGEVTVRAVEKAFFIRNVAYEDILKLGSRYGQEIVLFKDDNQFALIYAHDGQVALTFHTERNRGATSTFDPVTLRTAFSELRATTRQTTSGSNTEGIDCDSDDTEFFEIRVLSKPVRSEFYLAQKTKVLPRSRWIGLQEYLISFKGD